MSSLQNSPDASAHSDLVYGLDDRPSAPIALPVVLQHLLVIIVPIVTPGLLIRQALGVSPCDTNLIVSMSLMISGIAIPVQCKRFGPFDAGLLIVQGTNFNFVGPLIANRALMIKRGTPAESVMAATFGVVIAGSLVEVGISCILPFAKQLIIPLVTGIVVLMIGLTLTKVGLISTDGGFSMVSNGTFANGENLPLSGAVLGIIVILNRIPAVWICSCTTVIALAVDYALTSYLGHLDFTDIHQAELSQVPTLLHFGLDFSWPLFIPVLVIYLVTSLETIGGVIATSKASKQPVEGPLWMRWIKGGVLVNGANSLLTGIFSASPSSVSAQNNKVIQLAGVAGRYVGLWIVVMLALLGLFPSVVGVIRMVPEPILDGVAVVMFSTVTVSGINTLAGIQLDRRVLLTITVSLAPGLGVSQMPKFLAHMPAALRNMLGSGVTTGGICALLLNRPLPESPVQKVTH